MSEMQSMSGVASLAERIGWMVVHSLWSGGAIGILWWGILAVLKNAGANVRYWVTCGGMCLMVLAVGVTFVVQGGEASPMVARTFESEGTTLSGEGTAIPIGAVGGVKHADWGIEKRGMVLVGAIWLFCVGVLAAMRFGGWLGIWRLKRNGEELTDDVWVERIARLSLLLGVRQHVSVMVSAWEGCPAVVGWWRPVILMPASMLSGLSTAEIEAVVAHELAHVKRGDYLVNLIQTMAEMVLFYHPVMWWLSSVLRRDREYICDDMAARACGDERLYAGAIARVASLHAGAGGLSVGVLGRGQRGELLGRIRRILGGGINKEGRAMPSFWVLLVGVVALGVGIGWAGGQPGERPVGSASKSVLTVPATRPVARLTSRQTASRPTDSASYQQEKAIPQEAFYIAGVPREGVYKISGKLTLVQALIAGGLDPSKVAASVLVRRSKVGEETEISRYVTLELVAAKVDVQIGPGDTIIVEAYSTSGFYYVGGNAKRTGAYQLSGTTLTLRQAVIAAGGAEEGMHERDIILVRKTGQKEEKILTYGIDDLFEGKVADPFIYPSDTIMVGIPRRVTTQPDGGK